MRRQTRRGAAPKPPLEYSILHTATLCLLAAGAVMVFSASSAEAVLKSGDSTYYLKRYLVFGAIGLRRNSSSSVSCNKACVNRLGFIFLLLGIRPLAQLLDDGHDVFAAFFQR